MDLNIDYTISKTYLLASKRQSFVAILGVVIGMSIYIFMNCLVVGFDKATAESIFKNTAHLKIFKDEILSTPLIKNDEKGLPLIINPQIVPAQKQIDNPNHILQLVRSQPFVTLAAPQVFLNLFYNIGQHQYNGYAEGILPDMANEMYNIQANIVAGDFNNLSLFSNGIVIGIGMAEKFNLWINDNVSITSSKGITKFFKVVAIFKTNNANIDKAKSYVNLLSAQALLKENSSFITDIHVSVIDPDKAPIYAEQLTALTKYTAESWQQSNETLVAATRMRKIVISFVSLTILIVAGFGIYTILNMMVTQKVNEIAILKAIGFNGKDVVRIFVSQATTIGLIGVLGGMLGATVLIYFLKKVWIGGDIGFFPIQYDALKYLQGAAIGGIITFFAGYIPARKAAHIDPVIIFRK